MMESKYSSCTINIHILGKDALITIFHGHVFLVIAWISVDAVTEIKVFDGIANRICGLTKVYKMARRRLGCIS